MGTGASISSVKRYSYLNARNRVPPATGNTEVNVKSKKHSPTEEMGNLNEEMSATKEEEWNWNPFKSKDWKPDLEVNNEKQTAVRNYRQESQDGTAV